MSAQIPPSIITRIPADVCQRALRRLHVYSRSPRAIAAGLTFAASQGVTAEAQVAAALAAWHRYGDNAHAAAGPDGGWRAMPGSDADRVKRATRALAHRVAAMKRAQRHEQLESLEILLRELRIEGMSRVSAGGLPYYVEELVRDEFEIPVMDEAIRWARSPMDAARAMFAAEFRGSGGRCVEVDETTARAEAAAVAVEAAADPLDTSPTPPSRGLPVAIRSLVAVDREAPLDELGLEIVGYALLEFPIDE